MDIAVGSMVKLWQRFTLTRYFAASLIALGADTALFLLLARLGIHPAAASMAGYSLGIAVHWLISANIVFPEKVRHGAALTRQRLLFVASALLGLGLTVAVVALATALSAPPLIAKIFAVGISFVAVYAVRKWGIFK